LIGLLEKAHPVGLLCVLLGVSRTGYYRWCRGETYQPSAGKQAQSRQVEAVFWEHRRRYGSRRIAAELNQKGEKAGRHRVRTLMREQGLQAIQPKSFVPRTTQSAHGKRNSPNLLFDGKGVFVGVPTAPNRIWVSDITYLPLAGGGFGYLAVWLDLFSRMIVGWQTGETMEEMLVVSALRKGLQQRQPSAGLVLHSDRGGQYVPGKLRELMAGWHCRQSMGRAGEVYDKGRCMTMRSQNPCSPVSSASFWKAAHSPVWAMPGSKSLTTLNRIITEKEGIRRWGI
jgi:transposase InsO family protein